ncbi:MAG: hypothetical protein WCG87_05210 [Bacteroidota bacterium]
MTPKSNEFSIAKELYINSRLTQTEISHIVGVHRNTIGEWIRDNAWIMLRNKHRQMPTLLVEDLYHELQELNERISKRDVGNRIPTTEEANIRRHIVSTIRSLKQNSTAGEMKEAYTPLVDWLRRAMPHIADNVADYCEQIIRERIQVEPYASSSTNRTLMDDYCEEEDIEEYKFHSENENNSAA